MAGVWFVLFLVSSLFCSPPSFLSPLLPVFSLPPPFRPPPSTGTTTCLFRPWLPFRRCSLHPPSTDISQVRYSSSFSHFYLFYFFLFFFLFFCFEKLVGRVFLRNHETFIAALDGNGYLRHFSLPSSFSGFCTSFFFFILGSRFIIPFILRLLFLINVLFPFVCSRVFVSIFLIGFYEMNLILCEFLLIFLRKFFFFSVNIEFDFCFFFLLYLLSLILYSNYLFTLKFT